MTQTYHNIGIIGFGARGQQLAKLVYSQMPEFGRIAAYADEDETLVLPTEICLNCRI